MKALLFVFGFIFVVAGIATGVVSQMDYGNALIGLTPGLAATLLVGGFIVTGLAAVVGAVDRLGDDLPQSLPSGTTIAVDNTSRQEPGRTKTGNTETSSKDDMPFPAATAAVGAGATGIAIGSTFERTGSGVDAAVDKVTEVAKEAKEKAAEVTEDIADTAGDLADEAKSTTQSAVDKVAELARETKDDAAEEEAGEVATDTDGDTDGDAEADTIVEDIAESQDQDQKSDDDEDGEQLYIVEEVEVRGKSARVLSDNTVEAETDEGWMRFENIEHLEEYLDAMQA